MDQLDQNNIDRTTKEALHQLDVAYELAVKNDAGRTITALLRAKKNILDAQTAVIVDANAHTDAERAADEKSEGMEERNRQDYDAGMAARRGGPAADEGDAPEVFSDKWFGIDEDYKEDDSDLGSP